MKAVFVGGGALRLLGILRGAMAEKKVFHNGAIHLHDLNVERAEAMGRMLMKTPEYKAMDCKISWGDKLEKALPGADLVGVILRAGSPISFALGEQVSIKHGFASSDNISPNGAFLALKGASIIMDVAQKMEKICPDALLVDFANPVAVHSALVNNHTKIKAVGVCQGYMNHQWDLSRIIYGQDEQLDVYDVDVAGVNHLSYIVGGTSKGKNIFTEMDKALKGGWKPPKMQKYWGAVARKYIVNNSLRGLIRFYKELGVLVFSTEPDGMTHLAYEECFDRDYKNWKLGTKSQLEKSIIKRGKELIAIDKSFQSWLDKETDDNFWSEYWKTGDLVFHRQDNDIFVKIMKAMAGCGKYKIAVSNINNGAVEGFKDRDVLEYSQYINKGGKITAAGKYHVPDAVQGITSAIATHQTMLADAVATNDPQLLSRALMTYPIRPYSKDLKYLCKDLAKINADEMPTGLLRVEAYL